MGNPSKRVAGLIPSALKRTCCRSHRFQLVQLPGILQAISLEAMRDEALSAENADPNRPPVWKEGAKTFFFKGTNGRWKEVLCAAEVAMYEEKAAQLLTTDCRGWLEQGRIAFIEQ